MFEGIFGDLDSLGEMIIRQEMDFQRFLGDFLDLGSINYVSKAQGLVGQESLEKFDFLLNSLCKHIGRSWKEKWKSVIIVR